MGALSLAEVLHLVLDCKNDPLLPALLLAQHPALDDLARAPISDWMLIKGMTPVRAARLQAVLELHKRFATSSSELPIVRTATDAAALLSPAMSVLEQEQMRVLMLNTKNRVIGSPFTVYQGSTHTTVIRVSELFREATRRNATALIIAHNHPSGDPTPSPEDVAVTREIVQAGKILDIDVLDHLVIGASPCFVSLKERGLGFN